MQSAWKAFGPAALALLLGGVARADPVAAGGERDWTLIYYMSYDNDLDPCAPVILSALAAGVQSNGVAVAVLEDNRREGGLTRHVLTAEGNGRQRLATDDSAAAATLQDFLSWVRRDLPARHYAVIFLDHGGGADELCLDERPEAGGAPRWLSAQAAGDVLREFRGGGGLELLFLQPCGRASVESLAHFAGAARYVLASPLDVGKPNTYYAAAARSLAARPEATGLDLARTIMAADEHFNLYACFDGAALQELPGRLAACRAALGAVPTTAPELPVCYESGDEHYVDLLAWLRARAGAEAAPRAAVDAFAGWVTTSLLAVRRSNPRLSVPLDSLCGLTVRIPAGAALHIPVYMPAHLPDAGGNVERETVRP